MTDVKICSKCGTAPAGPGGVLCGPCRDAIQARTAGECYDAARRDAR